MNRLELSRDPLLTNHRPSCSQLQSPLLRLPAEIRNEIFKIAVLLTFDKPLGFDSQYEWHSFRLRTTLNQCQLVTTIRLELRYSTEWFRAAEMLWFAQYMAIEYSRINLSLTSSQNAPIFRVSVVRWKRKKRIWKMTSGVPSAPWPLT